MVHVYLINIVEHEEIKFDVDTIKLLLEAKVFFPQVSIDYMLRDLE